MKLFLASSLNKSIHHLDRKISLAGLKVAFITNPADPYKDKSYVAHDFSSFRSYESKIECFDLRKMNRSDLYKVLKNKDIIHVVGGSALYMIDLLRKKEMDSIIIDFVRTGRVLYTGTSAGSMICSPDLAFGKDDEDEKEVKMNKKIKNFKGLNLVPFYLMVHSDDPYYIPSTKKAMNNLPENKMPILFLNDDQAVWIDTVHNPSYPRIEFMV